MIEIYDTFSSQNLVNQPIKSKFKFIYDINKLFFHLFIPSIFNCLLKYNI